MADREERRSGDACWRRGAQRGVEEQEGQGRTPMGSNLAQLG